MLRLHPKVDKGEESRATEEAGAKKVDQGESFGGAKKVDPVGDAAKVSLSQLFGQAKKPPQLIKRRLSHNSIPEPTPYIPLPIYSKLRKIRLLGYLTTKQALEKTQTH